MNNEIKKLEISVSFDGYFGEDENLCGKFSGVPDEISDFMKRGIMSGISDNLPIGRDYKIKIIIKEK